MAEIIKGRNVKVEIAATFSETPKTITGVTKAKPGVASCVAHGLTAGVVGYFSGLAGMAQLEGQVARVTAPTADAFTLSGINTTSFADWSGTALFTPVATWVTLAESTAYRIPDGTADKLDVTTLLDIVKKEENGLLASQSISLDVLAKTTPSAAMTLIEEAAQSGGSVLVRITLNDGAQRLAYGEPSLPGENVGKGAVGTGSINISSKGFVLKLAPV